MKIALFGATGAVGSECLAQAIDAGHDVRVLVRDANKLSAEYRDKIEIVEGNALVKDDVLTTIDSVDAVLFAIGVDKYSPENLCTDVTQHIVDGLRAAGGGRFVWCGGGSTLVAEDQLSFGARFVNLYARLFLGLRHRDKDNQYALLQNYQDVDWVGVRPLQIRVGPKTANYQMGFIPFSGASWISFADVGHAMLSLLNNKDYLRQAPIIRY